MCHRTERSASIQECSEFVCRRRSKLSVGKILRTKAGKEITGRGEAVSHVETDRAASNAAAGDLGVDCGSLGNQAKSGRHTGGNLG